MDLVSGGWLISLEVVSILVRSMRTPRPTVSMRNPVRSGGSLTDYARTEKLPLRVHLDLAS